MTDVSRTTAPPLGIMPRKLHDQKRANAIHEAVNRYIAAGMPVPIVWIEEYNDIVDFVHGPKEYASRADEKFQERLAEIADPNHLTFDPYST